MKQLTDIDHLIAPRLEQDIYEYFSAVKLSKKPIDHQSWQSRFLDYMADWHKMIAMGEFDTGIWIRTFRSCVFASVNELKISLYSALVQANAESLVKLILEKMQQIFNKISFAEALNERLSDQEKHDRQWRERYCKLVEHSYELSDIKLCLGYEAGYAGSVSIFQLTEHLKSFDKLLQSVESYNTPALAQYRRVIRLPQHNQFMVMLYFIYDGVIQHDLSGMRQSIEQCWSFTSHRMGTIMSEEQVIQQFDIDPTTTLYDVLENFDKATGLESVLGTYPTKDVGEEAIHPRVWPHGLKTEQLKLNKNRY